MNMKEKILLYIKNWESCCYSNGIPDEAPRRLEVLQKAPSYKLICMAILRNDHSLKTLGFAPKVSKYYSAYKKIEIEARQKNPQLKFEL